MKTHSAVAGLIAAACAFGWSATTQADAVTDWNAVTLSCVQGPPLPANRGGPAGLLDIALVHAAMHDAVQAIQGRFEAYEYENPALRGKGSPSAAAAAAAYNVLRALYGTTASCLSNITDPAATYPGDAGLQAGAEAAAALLPHRRPTIALPTDPFLGLEEIGQWRPTTPGTSGGSTFLAVTAPFAMRSPSQFRPAPPPRLGSFTYARDYNEVKAVGGSASVHRTAEQTDAARFWTANFFAQWNQAVRHIAQTRLSDVGDSARLFALVNFAAADSQISVYETKYVYNLWRPVTAIQYGDADGNWYTRGDASWTPLIATPPYPEYSSGANCFTASVTTVLRKFFGTDKVDFQVWTTSANVATNPRTYNRFTDAEREMVDVRIWQGIHFRTAEDVGRIQGRKIGNWTYHNYLRPVRKFR